MATVFRICRHVPEISGCLNELAFLGHIIPDSAVGKTGAQKTNVFMVTKLLIEILEYVTLEHQFLKFSLHFAFFYT